LNQDLIELAFTNKYDYIKMMTRKVIIRVVPAFLFILLFSCASAPLDEIRNVNPSPELGYLEVVEIQLKALANNNEDDDGIEIAYRFAAPSNKRVVGPLESFILLFNDLRYAPMLNPRETEFLNSIRERDLAYQFVRIKNENGIDFYYIFVLQRQGPGEFNGSWMTIGVQAYLDPPSTLEGLPRAEGNGSV
jgi:hypothetical protein